MSNDTNWYSNVFKSWQAKVLGPKPTAEMLASIHKLGARPGKQALAIAMGLRDCGVTNSQIIGACGNPQLNKMRGYITDAFLKREAVPNTAQNHTVYKLVLTPKGLNRIKQSEARAAKADAAGKGEAPVKGDAKVKAGKTAKQGRTAKLARAARVKAAGKVQPTSEAPKAVETAPATAPVDSGAQA
jgi:hypothetical protein